MDDVFDPTEEGSPENDCGRNRDTPPVRELKLLEYLGALDPLLADEQIALSGTDPWFVPAIIDLPEDCELDDIVRCGILSAANELFDGWRGGGGTG